MQRGMAESFSRLCFCDLEVYTGIKEGRVEKGLGPSVVKTLTQQCQNTYSHIYFDNFFSSIDFFVDLMRVGLYGCGTIRTNPKGFPSSLVYAPKKGFKERGRSKITQQGSITVAVWQDNRPVSIIALNADPTVPASVTRKKRDGSTDIYPCPLSVMQYNKYMGGVDHNNQVCGYYNVRLKCRKYYKYIFRPSNYEQLHPHQTVH